MSTPKLQHYIPQMILRRFTDQSGWLYCCHVGDQRRPIWRSRPENVFAEKQLYTLLDGHDQFDVSIEKQFSVLEGEVSAILDKIVQAALSGETPCLGAKERETWVRFLVLQQRRVPDVSRPVVGAHSNRLIDETIAKMEGAIGQPFTARQRAKEEDRLRRNALPMFASTEPKPDFLRKLRATSIVTAVIQNTKENLVCGSRPIAGFYEWFCVHKKVAVKLESSLIFDQLAYVDESSEVRRINQDIVNRSTIFAGPSRELVESLARPR